MKSSAPLSPPSPRVQAIVFDAYGTLFDVTSVRAACRRALGLSRGDEVVALWRTKQLEYTWLVSLMGRFEDFWTITRRALEYAIGASGSPVDEADSKAMLEAYLQLETYADVAPALERLTPWRRAVLSNGSQAMLRSVVRSAGLDGSFEEVLSADDAEIFKPSPRVYQLACDALELPPASIAFVSSNPWDIAGATAFGFVTAHLARAGQLQEALDLPATLVLQDLAELPARLARPAV